MKVVLIGLVVALTTALVACGTDSDETESDAVNAPTTETVSVVASITSEPTAGETPTTVASSWEATPVPTTEPEPVPTPPNLPIGDYYAPTPEEIQIWEALIADEREVGDKILSETDQYKITYLISNRQASITIKEPPFETSKVAAEAWLIAQGLSPQSLCVISRINFHPSQEVMNSGYEFKAENTVPSGCDVPAS